MTPSRAGLERDIERYLLGRMSPGEQEGIEALLFEDDELCRAIEDTEDDLIDRYLSGDLSPEDRTAFEEHFAASTLRQERIAFRRVLPRAVAGMTAGSLPASAAATRRMPLHVSGRWIGLAAVVVAGLWLAQQRGTEPPASSGGSSGPAARVESPPPARPSGVVTASAPLTPDRPDLVLKAGLLRDSGRFPRLVTPLGALVRIDAELDAPPPATEYPVVLHTAEGMTVWRGVGRRHPGTNRVTVVIAAETLRPGDFILSIAEPARPSAPISEYPFAVRGQRFAP